jgi:hypothetical protein
VYFIIIIIIIIIIYKEKSKTRKDKPDENAVQDQILNTTEDDEMKHNETSEPCSTHRRYE